MDTDFIGPLESLQDKERGHSAFVHANKIQNRDILLFSSQFQFLSRLSC